MVYLLMAVAVAFNCNIESLIINFTLMVTKEIQNSREWKLNEKCNLAEATLGIICDAKLIPALSGLKKVETSYNFTSMFHKEMEIW